MERSVTDFPDFTIERPEVGPLIDEGVRHALRLNHRNAGDRSLRFALSASLGSVNALLGAAMSKCTIGGATTDIDMIADAAGDLIYQCHHNPTHRWDLSGHRI